MDDTQEINEKRKKIIRGISKLIIEVIIFTIGLLLIFRFVSLPDLLRWVRPENRSNSLPVEQNTSTNDKKEEESDLPLSDSTQTPLSTRERRMKQLEAEISQLQNEWFEEIRGNRKSGKPGYGPAEERIEKAIETKKKELEQLKNTGGKEHPSPASGDFFNILRHRHLKITEYQVTNSESGDLMLSATLKNSSAEIQYQNVFVSVDLNHKKTHEGYSEKLTIPKIIPSNSSVKFEKSLKLKSEDYEILDVKVINATPVIEE